MKMKRNRILFMALFLAGVMICGWITADRGYIRAEAADGTETTETTPPDTKVKPVEADYDALWLKVDANGNTKVYYSDKSCKTWYEAKSATEDSKELYYIDISWLSSTSNSIINLKGDLNDEIVQITFPARNSKFKAKFDKATGEINFENITDHVLTFQWRKATSYEWKDADIVSGKSSSDFNKEIEKLRISGASIYVRLPQTKGGPGDGVTITGFDPGVRQSKEIKINITKLAAAPKVTIDGTKMLLSSRATMEYSTDNGNKWDPMTDKMLISKISDDVLYKYDTDGAVKTGTTTKSVSILIRTKKTGNKPASKSFLLTIPAQRTSPKLEHAASTNAKTADVTWSFDESKFYLNFSKASKTEPYEYMVVKPGVTPDFTKGWKAVTSAKSISVSARTAPEGSTIYIRKKTIKADTKTNTEFAIASAYIKRTVIYAPSSTTTK